MKDGSCLTDRKQTHMEAHGSTLILTVDDEPTNHLVIEEIVTSHGYKVHSELDAREALKWVEDSPELPDLILLDCMMPEMSGETSSSAASCPACPSLSCWRPATLHLLQGGCIAKRIGGMLDGSVLTAAGMLRHMHH